VAVEAVEGLNTLIDFRYRQHFKAKRGGEGMGRDRFGAGGLDLTIGVPVGTQVLDEDKDYVLADLTEVGQRVVLARGGKGGLGNHAFKSSTNRAPRRADPGEPGEELWVWLRLKLIADAGLVGLPNAGKSTFLSRVSRAKPKIADYPFTTLHPNLGVVGAGEEEFVIADIPGLIEGAADGAGLGTRFLGHIERCRVLLHLIDGTQDDPAAAYETVRAELAGYGQGLNDKPEVLALNKVDAVPAEELKARAAALEAAAGVKPILCSGVTGDGVPTVLGALLEHIRAADAAEAEAAAEREPEAEGWRP
jgi:GTP-binding protein